MSYPIDFKQITIKTEFYLEVKKIHAEGTDFLMSFAWCKKIINSYLYVNLGSTICVFSF